MITKVLHSYPQYNLNHFYKLGFKDGGLTRGQLYVLFEHQDKRDADKLKIMANMLGINTDGKAGHKPQSPEENKGFIPFEHPDKYKNMTEAERKQLTERMKKSHESVIGEGAVHGGVSLVGGVSFR